MTTPGDLLQLWLDRQLPTPARDWFSQQQAKLAAAGAAERDLHITLGLIPRKLGKADLALQPADLDQAAASRPGWDPRGWSVDQAARILVLLQAGNGAAFAGRLRQLCRSADAGEAVAFYRGLPLYPDPALLEDLAAEGTRTNMRAVFEAVAHRNPFPREQFAENRWNHMILKALFVDSRLHPIQGLDARANPALARMLCDYAHERWAAGRSVSTELWRGVGAHADDAALADLARVLGMGEPDERRAAALALSASPDAKAQKILAGAPELAAAIAAGRLSWDDLQPAPAA